MRKDPSSTSGLFSLRILVVFSLFSLAALLAFLPFASTPPSDSITVPPTIGQTVSVTWTGTIPPLANASSDCTVLADLPAADTHTTTINVPPGTYNTVSAHFTFNISWTP